MSNFKIDKYEVNNVIERNYSDIKGLFNDQISSCESSLKHLSFLERITKKYEAESPLIY